MRKCRLQLWYCMFILPSLISLVVIVVVPFLNGIRYSFTSWNGITAPSFTGLENYEKVFSDAQFWSSMWFTIKVSLVAVIGTNVIGLIFALIVTQKWRCRNILRACYFTPNLIGGLILGFIWQFIFTSIFPEIGLTGWLADEKTGFWGLCMMYIWQKAGYNMVIFVAFIEAIPQELQEAATVDGVGPFQRFKHITFPMLMPAFTICLFITLSNSFKMYDQNLSLTQGGPYSSTEMLAMNIYNTAFNYGEMGYSQVKAVFFFILVAGITLLQTNLTKKREVEI